MAKRNCKENSSIMRVAPEFKKLVIEKSEKDGKAMTEITEDIAKKMRKLL